MTHSPLPWRQAKHGDPTDEMPEYYSPSQILDADGEVVADNRRFYPRAVPPDDQALIVRAVNAHAELVRALEACRDHIIGTTGARKGSDSEEVVQDAIAALKLARGVA